MIVVSYVIAAICAAALVLVLIGASADLAEWLPGATVLVLATGIVPFAVAIGVLHGIRQTGWLAHAVAGLIVSLVAIVSTGPGMLANPLSLVENWPVLVSGAIAGAIYWLAFTTLDRIVPRQS